MEGERGGEEKYRETRGGRVSWGCEWREERKEVRRECAKGMARDWVTERELRPRLLGLVIERKGCEGGGGGAPLEARHRPPSVRGPAIGDGATR